MGVLFVVGYFLFQLRICLSTHTKSTGKVQPVPNYTKFRTCSAWPYECFSVKDKFDGDSNNVKHNFFSVMVHYFFRKHIQ